MILAVNYIVGYMKDNTTKVLMDMEDIYHMKMEISRSAMMDCGSIIEKTDKASSTIQMLKLCIKDFLNMINVMDKE
jgi:hypothetical protein